LGQVEASPYPPPVPPFSPATNTNPNYRPWHGHITALSIAQSARRLGHATLLSEAIERGSDAENAWFVDLFVKGNNTPALECYRKGGYSVYRRVDRYYSNEEDALDMRKPLRRDVQRQTIRVNGEDVLVSPGDVG
jgi:N-terminal acetyltransferase B complex catalytic subunit